MNPLPSSFGWGAVILAFVAAILEAAGIFPDGSAAATIAKYGGILTAVVSGLAHSSSLGSFKAPKWFNFLGIFATVAGTLATSLQSDPNAAALVGAGTVLWINAAATFFNRFAHSITGTGGNP